MLKLIRLKNLCEGLRKQLGISGFVPVEEYFFIFGLRQEKGKLEGTEVNYLKKAFFELINFEDKIIFFPNRVSFSSMANNIGITAKYLLSYLVENWIPFKNGRSFRGFSLIEKKLNFLDDFLKTVIEKASSVLIEVNLFSYIKEEFMVDKYLIIDEKNRHYFFKGVACRIKDSLDFKKAILEKILLFKKKKKDTGFMISKEYFWDAFWDKVNKGEIVIKNLENPEREIKKWIDIGVKNKAFSFKTPDFLTTQLEEKIKEIIRRYI